MSWKSVIYLLVLVALSINATLYWTKPRTKIEYVKVESVSPTSDTSPPDTVVLHDTIKVAVVDTVVQNNIDTVYIYKHIPTRYYESKKSYLSDDIKIKVSSFGPAPADSIKIYFSLDFDKKISYIMGGTAEKIYAGTVLGSTAYGLASHDYRNSLLITGGVTAAYLLYRYIRNHK